MDLWFAPTSPFARKVRIAAAELDLADRLALIRVDPWADGRLRAINPLAKVPTLVLDDGGILFESAVICDYLDAMAPQRRLFPSDGPDRWQALLLHGLADGALTSAGRLFADERRMPDERSDAMPVRFVQARDATLDSLERTMLRDEPTIGEIAVAALLGYLDFRWPDRDWRDGRRNLSGWFDRFDRRPSMTTTRHAL